MPVLAANQVTLAEVLEVKGSPLNEEEIWAVLSHAGKAVERVLADGKGKQHGQPSLIISPNTLILSHSGHVKVSTHVGREKSKNPTYRAPELSSRTVSPSDGAVEKMYVYSLGMTLYFAAEYALNEAKMSHLSVSLGNLLLSMCEELARSRYSLRQVLAACGSKYGDLFYSKIIKSLVVLVLGNNIPEVIQRSHEDKSHARGYSSDDQHPSRSLRARYRSSLELPSPPLASRASRGQVTSEELIGSNDRTMTSPDEQPNYHSKNKYMTKIPHTLDKYRKYLEKARHQKTVTSPVVADRSIDLLRHRYGSMPAINGRHSLELSSRRGYDRTQSLDRNDKGYEESSMDNGLWRSEKLRGNGSGSLGNLNMGQSSDASSETSSLSDHHRSTLSSAPSSSLVSLMEGSYVPASSFTDLGSDYWGSMASLRDVGGSQRSGEWHRSSIGDLRSVSQLSSHDRMGVKNGFTDAKPQWPNTGGQRKYRSEQNLASPDAIDGEKKSKKIPKTKLRKFFGPEFVQVSQDPNQSLVNITPKKQVSDKHVSGRRTVTVVMLNEQRLEMTVESSTKVQELFDQITKYVGITEKLYFGLTKIEDDEHLFLDFDTKLSKHAPAGWKEQSKKFTGKYVLYFRVKFYVENLALFRHHETSHQLYLQLRSDVVNDRVYSDVDPVLNLASLALQAEYGDYSKKRFGENYFKPKHYLPHRILVKLSEDHVSQKLRALHKVQCGLSQEEAELKFIKESKKLAEYGMHLYKTKWSKKEDQIIYLGICVRGVTIFEFKQNKRKPLERHSWSTIKKLAFKKKKFYIEPRKHETGSKRNKLAFLSSSYKRSKYLLYLCTSFHRFQMRMKVRLLAMEESSPAPEEKGRHSIVSGYGPGVSTPHQNGGGQIGGKFLNGHEDDDSSSESREPSRASSADGERPIGQNMTPDRPNEAKALPYVLTNKKKTAEVIMSPDRKVKAIKLKKDARGALGLTVVGGEDAGRLHFGIFIKKISPGSIAHQDGRLQVGDRILAVNGKSLEYVSHDEAVQALKNTPVNVELLVSQSSRTDCDIDMSALNSPVREKTPQPSSGRGDRVSPNLVEGQARPGKTNRGYDDDKFEMKNVSRDLESAYTADVANPQSENSPEMSRPISRSGSDASFSNPSSPEQGNRNIHLGGVKLPGMTGGQLEDLKLTRNSNVRSSGTSRVSVESPGSIASFSEKFSRHSLLPDSDRQIHTRKSSDGSTRNEERLGLEKLPVGIVMDAKERRLSEDGKMPSHFTIELDKVSGSLGLNISGGINTNVSDGGIFVKSLYPNGAADLDGRIRVGHKILSVNGISLQGVTHRQAVETIKRAPVHAVLVIEGSPGGETADRTDNRTNQNPDQSTVFEVVLTKGIGGLGMSLVGGTDGGDEYGDQLRIKAMFPGQPADSSGKLRAGDIIMAANGVPLAGRTSRDAINVLRDQPLRVVLKVKRDPSSIPPGLLRRASFGQNLDPNEVLKAANARLKRDNSRHSRFTNEPENDEPSPREGNDSREISDLHASSSRNSSNAKRDSGGMLPHEHELPSVSFRENEVNYVAEGTSLDEGGTNRTGSELQKADNNRILLDKSELPEDCVRANRGTELSGARINRSNGEQADNGLRSQTPSRLLPNNESFTLGNYHQSKEQAQTGMEALGIADKKLIVPAVKFGGGVSAGKISDNNIVDGNDYDKRVKSWNPKPVETTQLLEKGVPSPLVSGAFSSQTGEDIGDEGGEARVRKGSSGRTFQSDKKERLAPDEEVLDIILHKGSTGLGFTLAGGADTVGGCFVREIIGDPARADGRLRAKDQIVMVNGQDTTNKKHMEAVNILRSTRNEVHLVIRRRPDKVKSKTKDGLDVKTISVIRTTRGVIGLTLAQDNEGQIYAAEVVPDEPAAKHGGLKRGDVILEINGERVDGNDLKFADDCLERARPVVTVVIKQFRSETESKYILCSPTESDDDEVPTNTSRAHGYNMVVVPPKGRLPQAVNSYNPDFLPPDETSPENVPTGVLYPEVEYTPEIQNSGILSSEKEPSAEPPSEPIQLSISHEPAQANYNEKTETWSADDSYGEEKITTPVVKEREGDATQVPGNEEYPSDDDELLLKEEVIITSLEKGPRGLGFSLFSGQTVRNTPGLFIRSIQPNSVVAEDGKIIVGDQLMKVNGVDVERLEHSEVITLLRSLSGLIKLELLRIQDEHDDEQLSTSLPRQPDINKQSADVVREEVDTTISPVTTPDFSEDVGIVLNALHTKQGFPLSDSQESLPTPEQPDVVEPPYDQPVGNDEEKIESWPQPPTSLELQSGEVLNEASNGSLTPMEFDGNQVATSEEETTSVTFSEDGFLEELEDLQYTPSPESDRVRSGNILERSQIPVKPGSTLSNNISSRMSDPKFKQESIEMSAFGRDKNTEHLRVSVDETEISMDNTMAETTVSRPEEFVSPLIPESFLNASQAASSSQATSPEVPPPLPTTPIPSDEDLSGNTGQRVTPRDPMTMRERFAEVVKQENKGRFDYPLRPKSPLITRRSKSVEPSGPLLEIQGTSSLYSGQGLRNIVQKLEKAISSGKAAGEFQALRELKPVDNCPSGKRALNKEKNRYRNVLPYEKTRVILAGDEQTDYINANYVDITVDSDAHHYIATQGPLPVTVSDFWRMVWEQECQVIAMVTLDMECGKVKCHRYWPESPELPVKVNTSLEVHLESVETHGNYVQRIIRIENIQEEQSLDVVHLNFVAWPDHGVPKSACDLVEFIKKFRENTSVGPSVVHCSAGIGRTGTLLTIDTCMKYIERGLEFDIYSIVHNLRQQRPGMIQTKDQYLFCYQACVEILKSLQA